MILKKILANKIREVEKRKRKLSLKVLKSRVDSLPPPKDFKRNISSKRKVNIIAEIKRVSPSGGTILKDFYPSTLARIYQENGASAISVLIDKKFFGGSLSDLSQVRKAVSLPVLVKEFILDPYQIYEARARGGDALLLIASILSKRKLKDFLDLASRLDLDCLVEIHGEEEWEKIKDLPLEIVGVNNRDLNTFEVDLRTTFNLLKRIPGDKLVVSESGIKDKDDIKKLKERGVDAFLIGEALLRSRDIGEKLREFLK